MYMRPLKKRWVSNLTLIVWLGLIITLSACRTIPSTSFEYQVRVQVIDTGANLSNAQVSIEVASHAPLTDITDVDGTARIFIDSSIEGQPARLIVELTNYKKYVKNIDLRKETLPIVISLTPEEFPFTSPTKISILDLGNSPTPDPATCPWIPYLNGKSYQKLDPQDCLNDLMGIGISGNSQKISFFVSGHSSGSYGICQDISNEDDLELHLDIKDNIIAARFLITIGPEPIPNKSTHVFRIQPQILSKQPKEMYIKFAQYTSSGAHEELIETKASPNWKFFDNWNFDFFFQFSGAKASAKINELPDPYIWSMSPGSRYLCILYEAIPTSEQTAQIESYVDFP